MSWDPVQREALSVLGYRLYRQVADPPAAPASAVVDPLLRALLRAAGRDADDPEAARLCGEWPPVEQLRGAVAKRALWPRLRALRGRGR